MTGGWGCCCLRDWPPAGPSTPANPGKGMVSGTRGYLVGLRWIPVRVDQLSFIYRSHLSSRLWNESHTIPLQKVQADSKERRKAARRRQVSEC